MHTDSRRYADRTVLDAVAARQAKRAACALP
jgi:hypothetical protein